MDRKEKSEKVLNIIKDYILPNLLENIGFKKDDITINNDVLKYIILKYGGNEDGVREIKRHIEELLLKINLLRLVKSDENKLDINFRYLQSKFIENIIVIKQDFRKKLNLIK
jgi:ATP-dependent Lon protease